MADVHTAVLATTTHQQPASHNTLPILSQVRLPTWRAQNLIVSMPGVKKESCGVHFPTQPLRQSLAKGFGVVARPTSWGAEQRLSHRSGPGNHKNRRTCCGGALKWGCRSDVRGARLAPGWPPHRFGLVGRPPVTATRLAPGWPPHHFGGSEGRRR
jgi:hypothetical protein